MGEAGWGVAIGAVGAGETGNQEGERLGPQLKEGAKSTAFAENSKKFNVSEQRQGEQRAWMSAGVCRLFQNKTFKLSLAMESH